MHVSFFEQYKSVCGAYSDLNGLKKYEHTLRARKDALLALVPGDRLAKEACMHEFAEFMANDYIRFVKYCFKGYAAREDEATYVELVEFFYARYVDAIEYKLNSTHNVSQLKRCGKFVDSFVTFLLEKNMK